MAADLAHSWLSSKSDPPTRQNVGLTVATTSIVGRKCILRKTRETTSLFFTVKNSKYSEIDSSSEETAFGRIFGRSIWILGWKMFAECWRYPLLACFPVRCLALRMVSKFRSLHAILQWKIDQTGRGFTCATLEALFRLKHEIFSRTERFTLQNWYRTRSPMTELGLGPLTSHVFSVLRNLV